VKQYDKLSAIEKLIKLQNPTGATAPDPGNAATGGSSTTVNVQTVNIMPVPQGMYIPAPAHAELKIIDHAPQPRRELQRPEAPVLESE
jgi:hypothetical protein